MGQMFRNVVQGCRNKHTSKNSESDEQDQRHAAFYCRGRPHCIGKELHVLLAIKCGILRSDGPDDTVLLPSPFPLYWQKAPPSASHQVWYLQLFPLQAPAGYFGSNNSPVQETGASSICCGGKTKQASRALALALLVFHSSRRDVAKSR
jgi:hypothetical protein